MKQLILRVEHNETKIGPFIHGCSPGRWRFGYGLAAEEILAMGTDLNAHYTPYDEFGRPLQSTEICGFIDDTQFMEWFPESTWAILERHGFVLSGIWSNDFLIGRSQVILKKEGLRRTFRASKMAAGISKYRETLARRSKIVYTRSRVGRLYSCGPTL